MSVSEQREVFHGALETTLPTSPQISGELAQILFRNSPDAIVITDDDGKFLSVNPAACALFGLSQEQMLQRRVSDFITPEPPASAEMFARYLQTGEEAGDFAFVRPDGQVRVASYSACRLAPDTHASILRDVTDSRRSEEKLRDAEAQLRAFYETSPLFMGVTEAGENDVLHLYDNPATCRYFGVEPGTTSGKWALADLHADPVAVSLWLECYRAAAEAGQPQQFEHEHPAADDTRWLAVTVSPLGIGMSGRMRFCYIAEDITERRKLEQARRESESQFRRLFEANILGILITDLSGTIRQANDAFLNLIGYSRAELEAGNISWVNLTPPELLYLDEEGLRQLRKRGHFNPYEKAYVHKDGRRIPVLVGAATLDNNSETAIAYVLDLTEQKAREQEIAELNTRLRRAMRETHHRVKNNLQVISAMIEMQTYEHRGEGTIPIAEFTRLKTHVYTLSIVHDLLTHSVKEQEEKQRISTTAALERLLPMLQQTAGSQSVRYSIAEVELSSKQCIALSLVLNELVSNALKHGNKEANVFFTVENDSATLAVYDDGDGFPEGFDARKAANTGLELVGSLVRTDLQGTIRYGNQPAGGGQVIITFPLPNE